MRPETVWVNTGLNKDQRLLRGSARQPPPVGGCRPSNGSMQCAFPGPLKDGSIPTGVARQ